MNSVRHAPITLHARLVFQITVSLTRIATPQGIVPRVSHITVMDVLNAQLAVLLAYLDLSATIASPGII